MRRQAKEDPDRHYYLRSGKLCVRDRVNELGFYALRVQEVVYFKLKSYTVRFVNEMSVTSSCRAYIILLFITFCKIIVYANVIARNWAHYL